MPLVDKETITAERTVLHGLTWVGKAFITRATIKSCLDDH